MFDMFWHSLVLFVQGRLFQSPLHVLRQSVIGMLATALVCIALVKLSGLVWPAVFVSALFGGALQPLLFKNLKYN